MFVNASNNAVAKLSSNINSSQTSLTVDDASIFPDAPFLITVNEEIMRVTSLSGNSLTVQRGREGTSASSHNAGSNVENNFTAGTYHALVDEIESLKQQSGIAEMGENENGSYIRYENGIQVCWWSRAGVPVSNSTSTYQGIDFYRNSNNIRWDYPKEFTSIPMVQYMAGIGSHTLAPVFYRIYNIGSTSANLQVQSVTSFEKIDTANYLAIGRWK